MANAIHHKLFDQLIEWLTREPPPAEVPPCDFYRLKNEIRPGDVLLIEGQSRVSKIIGRVTQSPWTHAALYIGRLHDIEDNYLRKTVATHMKKRENARLIIEGLLGHGNIVSPLSIYKHHHIRICRPIGLSPADAEIVIEFVIKSLGQPYSVRQILDLLRFLLPWGILPRRWGSSLFKTRTGEPEGGVCSSLIAEAFNNVHFPIRPLLKSDEDAGLEMVKRNPHLYTPTDFDYSPYFEIIKYPMLNLEQQTPYYRRLPWTKEGIMHHDDGVITDSNEPADNRTFLSKLLRSKHKKAAEKTHIIVPTPKVDHDPDKDDS